MLPKIAKVIVYLVQMGLIVSSSKMIFLQGFSRQFFGLRK